MTLMRYTSVFSDVLISAGRCIAPRVGVFLSPPLNGCSGVKRQLSTTRRESRGCAVKEHACPSVSTSSAYGVGAATTVTSPAEGYSHHGKRWIRLSPWSMFGGLSLSTCGIQRFGSPQFNLSLLLKQQQRDFSTRNISGRLFYRRRPKMIPRYKPKNRRSCWLEGCPQKKGVCITIRVVTPRKPNSGLRKVARVRLSTGRTVTCHVPGEGHNLHTHSVVLVRGGRCQDVSGCHYKVIRGKYDLLPVKNRASSRSKYGVRLSDAVVEKRRLRMNQLHVTTDLDREIFNNLLLHDWINPADGSRRTEPVGPDEPVDVDIFTFNSRLRSIVHSNSKS